MDLYQTIIKPITTEKSERFATEGKYIFIVRKGSTKIDIKFAIEKLYGVEVDKVNIVKNPRKERTSRIRGRMIQRRALRKKAIVTLKGKKKIDLNKFKK